MKKLIWFPILLCFVFASSGLANPFRTKPVPEPPKFSNSIQDELLCEGKTKGPRSPRPNPGWNKR